MSDKLREAAKAALMTLAHLDHLNYAQEEIFNLQEALAEEPAIKDSLTVAEPVAWMSDSDVGFYKEEFGNYPCVPLYAAPPRREWAGLTDEERDSITDREIGFNSCCGWESNYAKAIETKLREKNS